MISAKKLIHKRLNQVVDFAWRALSRLSHNPDKGRPLVSEDLSLCDELIQDMNQAEPEFRPTNYWQVYQDRLMPVIRREGIRKFRASRVKIFSSFGVSQIPNALKRSSPLPFNGKNPETHPSNTIYQFQKTLQAFYTLSFYNALQKDKSILSIEDSGYGCPSDIFLPPTYQDNRYTLSFLRYFDQVCWLKNFINMDQIPVFFELGSGYGGQAEVLLKLFPHCRYVICDIPPQVYVAEQYLKSVFPGEVAGYRETKAMDDIDLGNLKKRVTVITPWQIKKLKGSVGLFWSSTTFQEMEPATVKMYFERLREHLGRYVYLLQLPKGQHVAARKGDPGVIEPVTAAHYQMYLSNFNLLKMENAAFFGTGQQGIPYYTFGDHDHFLFEKK